MAESEASSGGAGAVLVTRPNGQAEQLCSQLRDAGYVPHHQPLLELQKIDPLPPEQRQRVLDLDLYRHVIFVSANAVRYGMEEIENCWPQLPVGVGWYAIGDATARLLGKYDIRASTPGREMTSEGLLELPELAAVAGERILLIRGEGGRTTLREVLSARGAIVDELACYRRLAPVLEKGLLAEKLARWQIAWALISSGEGLANLLALLSPKETTRFRGIILIVPSRRVADLAQQAGFEQVVTARNASDGAMLAALKNCKPSSGD